MAVTPLSSAQTQLKNPQEPFVQKLLPSAASMDSITSSATFAGAFAATLIFASGLANASLVARDLDGNAATAEAYYDTSLNITWLRDINHLANATAGMAANGVSSWGDGAAAASALNANSPFNFGLTGWRMPTANGMATIGGPGCQFGFSGSTDCGSNVDTSSSELAYMFHVNLGNTSQRDGAGNFRAGSLGVDFGLVNTADFLNLSAGRYWSGTTSFRLIFNQPLTGPVTFDFNDGSQSVFSNNVNNLGRSWLVHDGDVGGALSASVPEPGSLALVGLAGAGAFVLRRRSAV
jgi:hypothetical protein